MKRLFLFAVIAMIFATACVNKNATLNENSDFVAAPKKEKAPKRQGWSDYPPFPLYGDVESVTISEYNTIELFGVIFKKELHHKDTYKFNSNGDVVEKTSYNGNKLASLTKYDPYVNKLEEVNYNDDGSSYIASVATYDFNGNIIELIEYDSDGTLSDKYLCKYDSNGNIIEVIGYDSDGTLSDKYLYKYDSNGNIIEEIEYNSEGSLRYKELCKYDSNGNIIELIEYDSDGTLIYKVLYKYDSNGNMIEDIVYKSNGTLSGKGLYKYDSNGNMIGGAHYDRLIMGIMTMESLNEIDIVYRE